MNQEVWWARYENTETSIECPHCAGSKFITCIMGDETKVTIDCENCHVGCEKFSRGRIKTYERKPMAIKTKIIGMSITNEKIEYRVPSSYIVDEDMLFETEEAALESAKILANKESKKELEQIFKKEKDAKSWAWHATYHKNCIERAKKDIEYHMKKLDVANEKK